MIEGSIFIGAIVVALIDAIKDLAPRVTGAVTVLVAGLVGGLIALVDKEIGVFDITFAAGVLIGLAAAGTVGVARKIG